MGIGAVVGGHIQLGRRSCRNGCGCQRAVALQEFVSYVQRGGGHAQVVVAISARIGAARGRNIHHKHLASRHDVRLYGIEQGGIGTRAECQRFGAVVGFGDIHLADGCAAHGGDTAGDRIGRTFVQRQVFRARAARLSEGKAELDLGDFDIVQRQIGQAAEFDGTFIAGAGIDALTGLAARPSFRRFAARCMF